LRDPDLASGAAVLFFTSRVAIVLGASIAFAYLGAQGRGAWLGRDSWGARTVIALLLVAGLLVGPLWTRTKQQRDAGPWGPISFPVPLSAAEAVRDVVARVEGAQLLLLGRSNPPSAPGARVEIHVGVMEAVTPSLAPRIESAVRTAMGADTDVRVVFLREAPVRTPGSAGD